FREVGGWEVGTAAFAADFVFRWSDLDTHSHVSDIRILDAMSETRVAMNPADSTIHRMQHAADLGYVWMVARQDVDYLAPVPHQLKPYQVRVGFAKLGRTSLTLVAVLEDKIENIPAGDVGKVYARCTTVLVCGDRNARPIPLPEDMRLGLKRWPAVPTSD
ncbi:MAG: hypothetical protein FWG47_02970, partial [Propionibacteriaceae bacterium]|nr:hypothetical protein [Propionibacteriaceae bacterium]